MGPGWALLAACRSEDQPPTGVAAMYRGAADHSGAYPDGGARGFGGLAWRIRTDGPLRGSPTVHQGRVYLAGTDGQLRVADLDGNELLTVDLGSPSSSTPAVAGGVVYVQTRDDELLAVSTDGAVLWREAAAPAAPLAWGLESGDFYLSSPTLAGDVVLVGTADGAIRCRDAATGALRWEAKTGGRVRTSPAVAGATVYAGSFDGALYALDLDTGALRWRFDTVGHGLDSADFGFDRRSIQSSSAVVGDTVVFGARDGFLWAVDAATGQERWRVDHEVSWVITSPAVSDGLVFAGSSHADFVEAVTLATGEERWRAETAGSAWASPAVAGGVVAFADSTGAIQAFDAATGVQRWSHRLTGGVRSALVPFDGGLLVAAEDGGLYAVRDGGDAPLRRVVFWDAAWSRAGWFRGHEGLRDHLAGYGWDVVDTGGLAALMQGGPAVVVFAEDVVPPELLVEDGGLPLLRRWLDAGGQIVWVGIPPTIWPRDPLTGDPVGDYSVIDRAGASRLLDVDFSRANFDRWGVRPTVDGEALGLDGWWTAGWTASRASVDRVLATDEQGQAAAWIRHYGEGRFVMLNRGPQAWTDYEIVRFVADRALP